MIQDKHGESISFNNGNSILFTGKFYLDTSKNNSSGLTIPAEEGEDDYAYYAITNNLEKLKFNIYFPIYYKGNKAISILEAKTLLFVNLSPFSERKVSLASIGSNYEEMSKEKIDNKLEPQVKMVVILEKIIGVLEGGQVVAFNVNSGDQLWLFSPDDKQVWIEQDGNRLYSIGLYLYEINPDNGEVLRSMPVLDEITKNGFESFYSPMRIYGNYALLWHSFTKDVFIINLKDFKFEKMLKLKIDMGKKKLGLPFIFDASIIYHNGLLCILNDNKKLFILEKEEKEDLVQEIIISKEEYMAIADLPLSAIKACS